MASERRHDARAAGEAARDGGGEPAIGAYLARERKLRGISLDRLAADTRLPRRSLERLESGCFDGASDGFTRSFVRTVAVALGLDADQAVARTLPEPVPAAAGPGRGYGAWRLGLLAAAALVAAVVLWAANGGLPFAVEEDGPEGPAEAARVYRRDVVKALAEAQAAQPELAGEPVRAAAQEPDPKAPEERPALR